MGQNSFSEPGFPCRSLSMIPRFPLQAGLLLDEMSHLVA
jgi:hypothetical protein